MTLKGETLFDFNQIQFESAKKTAVMYGKGEIPLSINPQIRWAAEHLQQELAFEPKDMSRWSGQIRIPPREILP